MKCINFVGISVVFEFGGPFVGKHKSRGLPGICRSNVWYVIDVDLKMRNYTICAATVASAHLARSFAGRVLQEAHLYHLSGDGCRPSEDLHLRIC